MKMGVFIKAECSNKSQPLLAVVSSTFIYHQFVAGIFTIRPQRVVRNEDDGLKEQRRGSPTFSSSGGLQLFTHWRWTVASTQISQRPVCCCRCGRCTRPWRDKTKPLGAARRCTGQEFLVSLPWRQPAALLQVALQLPGRSQQQAQVRRRRLDGAGGELGVVLHAHEVRVLWGGGVTDELTPGDQRIHLGAVALPSSSMISIRSPSMSWPTKRKPLSSK